MVWTHDQNGGRRRHTSKKGVGTENDEEKGKGKTQKPTWFEGKKKTLTGKAMTWLRGKRMALD